MREDDRRKRKRKIKKDAKSKASFRHWKMKYKTEKNELERKNYLSN